MTSIKDLLYRQLPSAVKKGRPLLGFDFDGTLRVHRKKGFDPDLTARVLAKLSDHFNLAVFSNRSCGTPKSILPIQEYSARVDSLTGRKNTVGVMASRGDSSHYRKACTHMWHEYLELLAIAHDYEFYPAGSFFCGDAAGRDGDFAATDCAFAHNIGIRFLVPEQVFACVGGSWNSPSGANPSRDYSEKDLEVLAGGRRKPASPEELFAYNFGEGADDGRYFILLMGAPASGKTTLALELQRLFGSKRGCLRIDEEGMRKFPKTADRGSDVIIADATHPAAKRRLEVLDWARANRYVRVIVHMETPRKLCEHLNMARAQLSLYLVPAVAHRVYWKNLEPPESGEADTIISTGFHPAVDAPPEVTSFRY